MSAWRGIDYNGGGMKGYFELCVKDRLEDELGHSIEENADCLGGASTGGLIALGGAAGMSTGVRKELYERDGEEIFDDSWLDDLFDFGNASGADYDKRHLIGILKRTFGDRKLGSLKKDILIPTVCVDNQGLEHDGETKSMRRWLAMFWTRDHGWEKASTLGMCTAAAPTFFESHRDSRGRSHVDGGVAANMTALCMAGYAIRSHGVELKDVHVLSIGCGIVPQYIEVPEGSDLDWGWAHWAKPIVPLMFDMQAQTFDFLCRQFLGDGREDVKNGNYYRIDAKFPSNIRMDDASPEALRKLARFADKVPIKPAVRWLKEHGF